MMIGGWWYQIFTCGCMFSPQAVSRFYNCSGCDWACCTYRDGQIPETDYGFTSSFLEYLVGYSWWRLRYSPVCTEKKKVTISPKSREHSVICFLMNHGKRWSSPAILVTGLRHMPSKQAIRQFWQQQTLTRNQPMGFAWSPSQRHAGGLFSAAVMKELFKEPAGLLLSVNIPEYGSSPIFPDASFENGKCWKRTGYQLPAHKENYDRFSRVPPSDP